MRSLQLIFREWSLRSTRASAISTEMPMNPPKSSELDNDAIGLFSVLKFKKFLILQGFHG